MIMDSGWWPLPWGCRAASHRQLGGRRARRWSSGLLAGRLGGGDGDGPAGGIGVAGHAQVDGRLAAGGESVHLSEFCGGCGQADLQALGFAGPALLMGLGDAVAQVVADAYQAGPLRRVWPQEGTAQAP